MVINLTEEELRSLYITTHKHMPVVGSTNHLCMGLIARSDGDVLVTTTTQSEGRGRMQRPWHSPPGGLYFSLGVRGIDPLALAMIAPVATCASLRSLGVDARIRWPNDILACKERKGNERKLSGILIDVKGDRAVIGIGVNVKGSSREFSPDLREIAITLHDLGVDIELKPLLIDIIKNIRKRQDSNGLALMKEYASLCRTIGRSVEIEITRGRKIGGTASRLTIDGFLIVKTSNGDIVVHSCAKLDEVWPDSE